MRLLVLSLFLFVNFQLWSQGCGDAGFCTMHSLKMESANDSTMLYSNKLKFGSSVGGTQYIVMVFSPYVEYQRQWNTKWTSALKAGYSVHSGELTTTNAFSDIFISTSYSFVNRLKFVGGLKLPLNNANLSYQGKSLPMAYQTSLGTFDYILGLSYHRKFLVFSFAYQKPFIQNGNQFFISDFEIDELNSDYISTNKYKRSADILLRIFGSSNLGNGQNKILYGVLPIYHLKNDQYTNVQGDLAEIEGSQGFTLNLNLVFQSSISTNGFLELALGAPVISRDSRPDGLPQFSLSAEYSIKF